MTVAHTLNKQPKSVVTKSHFRQCFEEVVAECFALARLSCSVILSYFSHLLVFYLSLQYAGIKFLSSSHQVSVIEGTGIGIIFSNCIGLSVIIWIASTLEAFLFHVFGAKSVLSVYIQRAFLILFLCYLPLSALWFYTGEFVHFTGQDPLFVVLAEAFVRFNFINFYLNVLDEVIRRLLTCIYNVQIASMISKALVIINPLMFKSLIQALGSIGMSVRMSPFYFAMLFVCIVELLFRYRIFTGMRNSS